MKGYRKILIAVNGSKEVLTQGLKLACDEKCWVTVVKVLPPNEGDLNLVGVKNIGDVLNSNCNKEIAEINSVADSEGALVKTRIEEGDVHKKIVEVAEAERCDVIIMGARKQRTWLRKFFGDNVVEKVVNSAPCPVLVV
ncbi:MAG: universal stress protein [Nitrospirae bacterium]|nr:universal stress protein [Nitrospirota bacterium]